VIVHDFNIPRIVIDPSKADAPLVIYPNAHLTDSASLKDLQPRAARSQDYEPRRARREGAAGGS
jgi:hypothetical protein